MSEWVLIVTWLFASSAHSYQIDFASFELCQNAMLKLARDNNTQASHFPSGHFYEQPTWNMECLQRK
jgi:hypothetical protein